LGSGYDGSVDDRGAVVADLVVGDVEAGVVVLVGFGHDGADDQDD
jgi:hypothetical protein